MRVLIADDHAMFRRGLRETIGEAFPKVTFAEAKTAEETLELVRQQDWEIVILDISMPGKSGLDILDDLKHLRPKLPVLFLSMHPEEQYARRALKAGAAGYLTKESVPEELKTAVKRVLTGGRYVSATLAEKLASDLRRGADLPVHELLSDREFEGTSGARGLAMWDAGGRPRFILSYKGIPSRPDVFPAEFVVLWRCANGP